MILSENCYVWRGEIMELRSLVVLAARSDFVEE